MRATPTPNEIDKIDSVTCQGDRSGSEEFRRAGRATVSSGPSTIEPDRWPATHEHRGRRGPPGRGVIVADVDLGSVVDAIRRAQIGTAGYAYAVDAGGRVIAHTANNSLVLADTNLGALPQVHDALAGDRPRPTAWSPTDAIRRARRC